MATAIGIQDPCLACGVIGSVAYAQCHAALAAKTGPPPACAQSTIASNSPVSQPAVANDVQSILANLSASLIPNISTLIIRFALFIFALLLIVVGFLILK